MICNIFVSAAIISGLVAFGAVCLGHYLKLEYAGKLLAMTFILVIIGADERVGKFLNVLGGIWRSHRDCTFQIYRIFEVLKYSILGICSKDLIP